MDPGERRGEMGDRQDGAGMGTGTQLGQQEVMEAGMLLPGAEEMLGTGSTRHPGQQMKMVKDTCLCPAR